VLSFYEAEYKRWDELSPEEQREIISALEELSEEQRLALFKEEPYAEKIWLEKKPKPIGTEYCPEGLVDIKEMSREYWGPLYPEIYEAYDRIPKGWLWFCRSTRWFYEKVEEGLKEIPPDILVKRIRQLVPLRRAKKLLAEGFVKVPMIKVDMPNTPAIPLSLRYPPDVLNKMFEEKLKPGMSYEEVRALYKIFYGWDYDEKVAAARYAHDCFSKQWPLPDWVKKYGHKENYSKITCPFCKKQVLTTKFAEHHRNCPERLKRSKVD
jgi:hypothetical protein